MPIITLTTDFGEKDHFAGTVKGSIYSELSDVRIVDVSHSISPFNIIEAAYTIQNAYNSFPEDTIHIIGIMSMICQDIAPEKIVEINIHDKIQTSFPVLDVFVKVACHIARGGTLEVIGKVINNIKPIKYLVPFVNDEKTQIIGTVIHVDNYGNVITNIKRKFFEGVQKTRNYEIAARNYKFKKVHDRYSDIINFDIPEDKRNDEGKALVVFNASDYLEIAVYKSN